MADRIFEIENCRLKCYTGNYTTFAEKKRQIREADLRAYNKQQDEIRRQEDIIRKFKERGTEHLESAAPSTLRSALPQERSNLLRWRSSTSRTALQAPLR